VKFKSQSLKNSAIMSASADLERKAVYIYIITYLPRGFICGVLLPQHRTSSGHGSWYNTQSKFYSVRCNSGIKEHRMTAQNALHRYDVKVSVKNETEIS